MPASGLRRGGFSRQAASTCWAKRQTAHRRSRRWPKLQPEIVLLDVQLPDLDGFAVAERLASDGVPAAIVLISSRDVSSFRRRLAANPAWSFIPKSELSGEALSAVAG